MVVDLVVCVVALLYLEMELGTEERFVAIPVKFTYGVCWVHQCDVRTF
jgi:hypothetical protein